MSTETIARMDLQRRKVLVEGKEAKGPVVYWMSRDQRVADNMSYEGCKRKFDVAQYIENVSGTGSPP